MPASAQECLEIQSMIKNIDPKRTDKAYDHFLKKSGATKEQIVIGALTQQQAFMIIQILKKSSSKND